MGSGIVGRDVERAVLESALASGRHDLAVAVVVGEAGMGKTALVLDVVEAAAADRSVRRCTARAETAGAPLALIDDLVEGLDVRVDDDADPGTELMLAAARVVEELESMAAAAPAILVVDDLQWADGPSVEVLRRALRRVRHEPLTVFLVDRPVPDGEAVGELRAAVEPLGGVDLVVGPLDDEAAAAALAAVAPNASEEELDAWVRRAGGNPLYLRHLAAARAEREGSPLTGVVVARLVRLAADARRVVGTAAVQGSQIDPATLAAVCEIEPAALARHLGAAVDVGLLVPDGEAWRFDHDLVRDEVLATVEPAERGLLHRAIAAVLGARGASTARAEGAAHLLAAGPPYSRDELDLLIVAARDMLHTEPDRSVALLDEVVANAETDDARRHRATQARSEARAWAGSAPTANEGDPLAVLRARFERGTADAEAVRRAEDHVRATMSDPRARDEGLCIVAKMAAAAGLPVEELLDELDGRAHDLSVAAQARLRSAQSIFLMGTADLERAKQVAHEARRVAERLPEGDRLRVEVDLAHGRMAAYTAGDEEDGLAALAAAEHHAERLGSPRLHMEALTFHGVALSEWGRWDEAEGRLAAGRELALEVGAAPAAKLCARQLVRIHSGRGDRARATEVFDEAVLQPDAAGVWALEAARMRLLEGRDDVAVKQLIPLATDPDTGAGLLRGVAAELAVAAHLADDQDGRDALRVAAGHLRPTTLPAIVIADLVRALLDADPAVFERYIEPVSYGPPPMVAAPLFLIGALTNLAAGDDGRAGELAAESRDRWATCGATAAVALVDRAVRAVDGADGSRPSFGWDAVTDAEMRVVRLVAEGVVYREVGERLFISRRTVESHVASVLRKVGVRNRGELAAAYLQRPR